MQENSPVVIIGASGFGRESLDVVEAMQAHGEEITILGIVDDYPSRENLNRLKSRHINYLGTLDQWLDTHPDGVRYLLGIGNTQVRRQLVERLDARELQAFTAIHPTAVIGSCVTIFEGSVVCAGAVISTNVHLGRHVHVNPSVTIGHDATLGDFVSVNPAAVISGDVRIDDGVLIGASSTVLQQLVVGANTIVGAAALVTRNVPSQVIAKGIPARW